MDERLLFPTWGPQTAFGVPFGANTPSHVLKTNPRTPCSANVGVPGRSGERCSLGTASARTRACLMNGSGTAIAEKATGICPATTSVVACAAPR